MHQTWQPGRTVIHVNGSYHSDRHSRSGPRDEGILHYLRKLQPKARFVTLSTVQQDDLQRLLPDYYGRADFILVVPESFPKSR